MRLGHLPLEIRPLPALMKYYALSSLAAGPFFFFPLAATFARYRSLRYRIDEDGITMRWGVLFRREVSLNYGRIQDIHLSSNVLERWLGLGKIQIQTASGSSEAEMTIEGIPDLGAMRDFLYRRMQGARGDAPSPPPGVAAGSSSPSVAAGADRDLPPPAAPGQDDLTVALRAVADELRALRADLGREPDGPG